MKLSTLIAAWDIIHTDDTLQIGFQDFCNLWEPNIINDCLNPLRNQASEQVSE